MSEIINPNDVAWDSEVINPDEVKWDNSPSVPKGRKPFVPQSQKFAQMAGEAINEGRELKGGALTNLAAVTGTLEDLIFYPAMHFGNQFLMNLPRSEEHKQGLEYPEKANTPAGQLLSNLAGVAGAVTNPIGKIGIGVAKAPTTLANLAKLSGAGALGGALYSPNDDPGNMRQRAEQATVGAAVPIVGAGISGALSKIPNKSQIAGRIVNSLIKPLKKDFSYGKNPGLAVAQEGIIANDLEDLANKIGDRRNQIGQQIGDLVKKAKNPVNMRGVLSPIDAALSQARQAPNTNAGLISRLDGLRNDLRKIVGGKDIQVASPQLAFKMKQQIGDLTKWTGNPSDDQLVNKALKMVYGKLKERMELVLPETAPLNERYANLTSAHVATKYRDVISQRQNMMSLTSTHAGIGAAILTSLATGGKTLPSVLVGASFAGLTQAAKTPAVKTRIATWLAKSSPNQISNIMSKIPNLRPALLSAEVGLPSRIIDKLRSDEGGDNYYGNSQ